jgi:hypothetical protein
MATRTVLPVIFRAEKSGQFKAHVTAVFPTLPGTSAHDFTVYAHVGQHSTGSHGWYYRTRAAKPAEYAPLLSELRGIYESDPHEPVKLRVVERFSSAYDAERRKTMEGYRASIPSASRHESGGNPRTRTRTAKRRAPKTTYLPPRPGAIERVIEEAARRKLRPGVPLPASLEGRIAVLLGKGKK